MKTSDMSVISFKGQIAPGRGAVSFEGTQDGAEIRILVPESEKALIAPLPYYFLQRKLLITMEIIKE